MKNRSFYNSHLSFIDLLLNSGMIYAILFLTSFAMINTIAKKNDVETKADALISLEWAGTSNDDVDIWVRDPMNRMVFYKARQIGFMSLDKDDTGILSNTVTLPDGTVKVSKMNKEVVTLRGIVPGKYTVNAFMYMKRDTSPTLVHVTLLKLNPYDDSLTSDIVLEEQHAEKTAFSFVLSDEGNVASSDTEEDLFITRTIATSKEREAHP